jgi:long-chain acyl-CoA synthetase
MKLLTLLAAQAAHRSRHTALIGERRVSFARAVQALRARGVRAGNRVALVLPNGVPFVEAFLTVVKASAVAVPVNLRLSADEVDHILRDSESSLVIRDPAEVADLIATGEPGRPDVPFDADDCVISYTSGTTGKPKGAVLTRENYIVLNGFLNGMMWRLGPHDRQLVTTPLAHNGAGPGDEHGVPRLHPHAAAEVRRGSHRRLVESEKVTLMGTVPTVARLLLPEIDRDPGCSRPCGRSSPREMPFRSR